MRKIISKESFSVGFVLLAAWLATCGLVALGATPGPAGRAAPPASSLDFQFPSSEAPVYRIHFLFEVKADTTLIKGLTLNAAQVTSYLVFSNGKSVEPSSPLDKGIYSILLDYAWSSGKKYAAALFYQPEGRSRPAKYEVKATSPKDGGIPAGQEGFYRIYTVEEEAGLERKQEVCTLTLTAPKNELEGANLVVFDRGRAIPFEVVDKEESRPVEKVAAKDPVTLTWKIILRLDASPREKRWLLVLKGENPAETPQDIRLTGEGLGKTVQTPNLTLEFSPRSGQVNIIESSEPPVRLYNNAGVIHWNPDVFIEGIAWDHSFDWNPPAAFSDKAGGLAYVNSRGGPLPHIQDVLLDVRYTIEASSPYFLSETRLDFKKDLGVIAVRNDEMVLARELFDSLLYRDKTGGLVKLPLKEMEAAPNGLAHIAPMDLDWVGLVNTARGYGFFSLRVEAANGNLELPGAFLHRASTCFYAPSKGSYVYWVRPLVYTWADYFTDKFHSFVPRGSFFYEKNAYGVWRMTEDLPRRLDELVLKLRHPLRIY
jgi:hypothetical protein